MRSKMVTTKKVCLESSISTVSKVPVKPYRGTIYMKKKKNSL